jgi:hypothetical protein
MCGSLKIHKKKLMYLGHTIDVPTTKDKVAMLDWAVDSLDLCISNLKSVRERKALRNYTYTILATESKTHFHPRFTLLAYISGHKSCASLLGLGSSEKGGRKGISERLSLHSGHDLCPLHPEKRQ